MKLFLPFKCGVGIVMLFVSFFYSKSVSRFLILMEMGFCQEVKLRLCVKP